MEYVTSGGTGVISKWADKKIEADAKNDFHDLLNFLEVSERDLWVMPDYKHLSNLGLGEIRWKSGEKQHRVFGFFDLEKKQFIMLLGGWHKDRVYTPADALNSAKSRKEDVIKKDNDIQEYKWKETKPSSES